nr:Alr1.1 [Starmerella bombicola]
MIGSSSKGHAFLNNSTNCSSVVNLDHEKPRHTHKGCEDQSNKLKRERTDQSNSDELISTPQSLWPIDHSPTQDNEESFSKVAAKVSFVNSPDVNMEGETSSENLGISLGINRFSLFASERQAALVAPNLKSLAGIGGSFAELFSAKNGVFLLDCLKPNPIEMRALSRAFGIHPLTAEDIQTQDAREKLEVFKNYTFIAFHSFGEEPISFYILIFERCVLSFHFEPVTHCQVVGRRMRQLHEYISVTSEWIAYALIDDIADSFAPRIREVEDEVDFVEHAIYMDLEGNTKTPILLEKIGEGKKHAVYLLRMLSGKSDVVRALIKRIEERSDANDTALYLGDVLDHLVTMDQNLRTFEKIFGRVHYNYMGLLQMEFVDATNVMTGVLSKLTIVATVLLPMNLVAGLWGMNVHVPGQNVTNLGWFFGILSVIIFVTLMLCSVGWYIFKYRVKHIE